MPVAATTNGHEECNAVISKLERDLSQAAGELAELRALGSDSVPVQVAILLCTSLAREARLPGFERVHRTIRDSAGNVWTSVPVEQGDARVIRVLCEVSAYQANSTREELGKLEKELSKNLGDLKFARAQMEAARVSRDSVLAHSSAATVNRLEPTIDPLEKRVKACRKVLDNPEELMWEYPADMASVQFATRVVRPAEDPLLIEETDGPDSD